MFLIFFCLVQFLFSVHQPSTVGQTLPLFPYFWVEVQAHRILFLVSSPWAFPLSTPFQFSNFSIFFLPTITFIRLKSVKFHIPKACPLYFLVIPVSTHLARAPSGSARLICACGPSSVSRWADTSCCLSWAACWASTTGVRRSSALLSFVAAWKQKDTDMR